MKEIVGKNGLQILTFWCSLQTGKMSSSSRNGDRQTANAGNVGSRDPLCRSREKKYAVLNLSNIRELTKRRRRRQRRRYKTIGLVSKNNGSARAFYILVHFFAVIS